MGAAVVGVGEGAEAFLASGVEEVEAVAFAMDGEFLKLGWVLVCGHEDG